MGSANIQKTLRLCAFARVLSSSAEQMMKELAQRRKAAKEEGALDIEEEDG